MGKNICDIAIIGGGASGLMLASRLDLKELRGPEGTQPGHDGLKAVSEEPARGIILEGSQKPGAKLLMSGGGRCNITHGGSVRDFINAYGDAGPSLRRCLYRHSNLEFVSWLSSHGLELSDENGRPVDASASLEGIGRIFPASMKAQKDRREM